MRFISPVSIRITQADVECVLKESIRPQTATEITKALTGRKLILAADDAKVRRHLNRMTGYGVLTTTGKNADGEYYYQYAHKVNK